MGEFGGSLLQDLLVVKGAIVAGWVVLALVVEQWRPAAPPPVHLAGYGAAWFRRWGRNLGLFALNGALASLFVLPVTIWAALHAPWSRAELSAASDWAWLPLDLLLHSTESALVDFELDLYWVTKGGGDPLDYFARFPGRFTLWHVKDMDATEQRSFAEVGTGVLDFPAIFARSEEAGAKHYFVEQDVVKGEIWGVVERSRKYVSSLRW